MSRVVILVLGCAMIASVSASVHARGDRADVGIRPLTKEGYPEAIACGRTGADCAVTPYLLCPSGIDGYSAWIATPFSRVASSVFERVNRRQRVRPMELGPANSWGLGIYVSPAEDYSKAASITRVIITRAGHTIEPKTATIAPITVTGPEGASKEVSRGYFAFPMDALSPTTDVTVVLVGPSRDVTCALSRDTLLNLR